TGDTYSSFRRLRERRLHIKRRCGKKLEAADHPPAGRDVALGKREEERSRGGHNPHGEGADDEADSAARVIGHGLVSIILTAASPVAVASRIHFSPSCASRSRLIG